MNDKIDAILYRIGLWTGCAIVVLCLLIKVLHIDLNNFLIPCVFHYVTGLYCPGCGGTRAVKALFQGKLLLSFLYHPFVLYSILIYSWYMVSNTIERCANGKIKIGMRYKNIYLWIGIILILVNWVVKNVILLLVYRT